VALSSIQQHNNEPATQRRANHKHHKWFLCRAGGDQWEIDLSINLFRLTPQTNPELQRIWQY
jgi:hypothetical protein